VVGAAANLAAAPFRVPPQSFWCPPSVAAQLHVANHRAVTTPTRSNAGGRERVGMELDVIDNVINRHVGGAILDRGARSRTRSRTDSSPTTQI
jgi:hypothetical protein